MGGVSLPTVPLIGALPRSIEHGGLTRSLRVVVCAGLDAGRVFEPGSADIVLGRGKGADVCLSDQAVSQFHMSLKLTLDGVSVRDLGSRNGIWLAGVRLERATVPLGTLLSLGNSTVRVDLSAIAARPVERLTEFGRLVGRSECMQKLYARLIKLAPTNLSVLIEGETGTGKEEIARSLYEQSQRASQPFVVIDCTTLPESLAPSLLFGHEKGAFSGATERKTGLFQAAHGGVLFLDEIGDLNPSVQAMLLRAVQHQEVKPVGGVHSHRVDVRILCATWRDLRAMVNDGRFREDLFYRLAEATVQAPSLAERREDIPLLVEKFLNQLPKGTRAARSLEPVVLDALKQGDYPGNVRELGAMVKRLAQLADGPVVTMAELSMERHFSGIRGRTLEERRASPGPLDEINRELPLYHEAKQTAVDSFEKEYLMRLMARANGNLSRAAALAGVERQNLRSLLRKHSLYVQPSKHS